MDRMQHVITTELYNISSEVSEQSKISEKQLQIKTVFDRNHSVVLYQYNIILVSLQTHQCIS